MRRSCAAIARRRGCPPWGSVAPSRSPSVHSRTSRRWRASSTSEANGTRTACWPSFAWSGLPCQRPPGALCGTGAQRLSQLKRQPTLGHQLHLHAGDPRERSSHRLRPWIRGGSAGVLADAARLRRHRPIPRVASPPRPSFVEDLLDQPVAVQPRARGGLRELVLLTPWRAPAVRKASFPLRLIFTGRLAPTRPSSLRPAERRGFVSPRGPRPRVPV